MIVLENLVKSYPNGRGVRGIDLEFGPGIHGLIGLNGAGKTTILKLIMGILSPNFGRILVDGSDIAQAEGDVSWRRSIGYFPAEDYFFGFLSGKQNLEYIGLLKCGDKEAWLGLAEVAAHFGIGEFWDEAFTSLSTGQRKKIELVGSLMGKPSTLIWDEPNNGVDIMGNLFLRDYLGACRARGMTVILSSHVIEFMDGLLDSLTVVDDGEIRLHASPAPADLRSAFLASVNQ
jgi:ABC-2 type transport system ATP-binding protein